jgi:hypothetical protein
VTSLCNALLKFRYMEHLLYRFPVQVELSEPPDSPSGARPTDASTPAS